MRENIKNVGLILAIVIAGVSLPTSIISIMNKPTTLITEVNNYYYNNTIIERYYYNETDSELNINYTESTITFLNLTNNPEWFYNISYNLIKNYKVFFDINNTFAINQIFCYIIPDYLFEFWIDSNPLEDYYHIGGIKVFSGAFDHFSFWIPESSGIWHFAWFYSGVANNVTIKTIYPLIN